MTSFLLSLTKKPFLNGAKRGAQIQSIIAYPPECIPIFLKHSLLMLSLSFIFRPHSRFLTAPRALRTCVAVTIISGVLNSPVLLTVIYDRTRDSLCGSKIYVGGLLNGLLHSLFIVAFIIMFIVVCICYAKVAYTIKTKLIQNDAKNSKNTEQSKESVLKSKTTLSTNLALTNNGNKDLVFEHKKKIKINKVVPVADGGTGDTADHEGLFDLPSATFDTHSATCSTEVDKASKSTELLSIQSSKLVTNNKQKERKRMADTRVDRTTKIMFAVTMVFLLSWIPTWSHYFYILLSREDTVAGEVYKFFARKAYMVNTFTNPFFYIWLSSAFKERTRKVLKPLRGLLKIRRSAP